MTIDMLAFYYIFIMTVKLEIFSNCPLVRSSVGRRGQLLSRGSEKQYKSDTIETIAYITASD